jgi:hypothetical protein
MSHFHRWNNITIKLKNTLWKNTLASNTYKLPLGPFQCHYVGCDYAAMQTIHLDPFCPTNCKINCSQTLEIFSYSLLIWKLMRSHISEIVTLEKASYVKKNKWKMYYKVIFIEQKYFHIYQYGWHFSLTEIA